MRIGIYGYGNLGKGVELAIKNAPDCTLVGVFSRRSDGLQTQTGAPVYSSESISDYRKQIDVLIVCGGSRSDLPWQTPALAKQFNVVDSFDTHAEILKHYRRVGAVAKKNKKTALICAGWDPGLFSIHRLLGESILPEVKQYTFWGKGVSQGHSEAIKKVDGVSLGVQYTLPNEKMLWQIQRGETPDCTPYTAHKRECFVVAKHGADEKKIEEEIKNMPDYFSGYQTGVRFISEEEFLREHLDQPHGGRVISVGKTGEHTQTMEFSLALGSNPEFTGAVLTAYARAVYALYKQKNYGVKTPFDIPPFLLSPKPYGKLLKEIL